MTTRTRGTPAREAAAAANASSLALTTNQSSSNAAAGKTAPNKVTARSVPAFLNKLFTMVNDPATDELIRWSEDGDSFFVPSADRFGRELLPRFFKHSNFGSFVRQLNMYGFHKVPHLQQGVLKNDSEEANELLEFSNPHFTRAQPDLLCLIRRQKARTDAPSNPTETALDLPTLLTDLAAIRKHQTALSADLKDLQTSNNALWQEAIQSRERHTKHQETINKILRFLATVFGGQVTAEGESPAAANVVDEEEQKGEGKGKAKGKEVPSAVLPKMRSRLLLEDVKGRKEARDKKRREEEEMDEDEDDDADSIEEIPLLRDDSDDLPTISSASRYSRPTMARSASSSNAFAFPNNTSASKIDGSDSTRFTTLPSSTPTPTASADTPTPDMQYQAGLPPDILSSLFSPSNSNTLAAFLQLQNGGGLNTAPPSTSSFAPSTSAPGPLDSFPPREFSRSLLPSPGPSVLSPTSSAQQTLAGLLPPYEPSALTSEDYTQAINDHNDVLRDVTTEKADIDQRTTALEMAIAKLMQTLPVETREQLTSAAEGNGQSNGVGLGGVGDQGMQWGGEFGGPMADAELEKLLAQYSNDGGAVDSEPPTDYSYLFDPDSALGSNQLETLSPSESMFGSGGSDGRSTVESPIDRDDDDYVEEGTKTRGKKRKSEGGDARAGNRKKVA